MRLSLLLKQTHMDGANDGRKWRHKCAAPSVPCPGRVGCVCVCRRASLRCRHSTCRARYMVELLRRASLERRNEQLARRVQHLEASGAQGRQPSHDLPEPWEAPGELVELLPSACSEMWELHRLQHLDLAHMGGH